MYVGVIPFLLNDIIAEIYSKNYSINVSGSRLRGM